MHGPDNRNYRNESIFVEIEPSRKVVIQHVSEPKYRLTIGLASTAVGTLVSWSQVFENSGMSKVEHIIKPANEQNLDRLTAEVLKGE